MKIQYKKVVRPLDLADFAPEYAGAVIQVWVNPTREKLQERETIRQGLNTALGKLKESDPDNVEKLKQITGTIESINDKYYAWLADNWSQAENEETHWTQAEVKELAENLIEDDPALWEFIQKRSFNMLQEYREHYKKKLN